MEKAKSHEVEISVEEKLRALYSLQLVDSEIDKIKTLRGELPLEVQDLEDEIAGLETRLGNLREEVVVLEKSVQKKNIEIGVRVTGGETPRTVESLLNSMITRGYVKKITFDEE